MSAKNEKEIMSIGPVGSINIKKGNRAKMGGPFTEGSYQNCICPSCGYEMIYIESEPCAHKLCPKCNNKMSKK